MDQAKKAQNKSCKGEKRPYISIFWKCCGAYSRVYRNKNGSAYEGYCPRCRGYLKVPVGEGGTNQRTFTAG